MRAHFVTAVSMSLALAACQAPPPPAFGPAEQQALALEVAETLTGLTEAMNAHDPDSILAHYRQTQEFLYLGCVSFLTGFDDYGTRVAPYYRTHGDVSFVQEIVRIQVLSPTVAVAALRGASTEADALFWTQVLVKEDGRWLIAHEHESWPGCPEPPSGHPGMTDMELVAPGDSRSGSTGG